MLRKVCAALVGISWLAVGWVTAVAQEVSGSSTEKELVAVIEKMIAAQQNFDPAALGSVLTADYVEVSPVGEVDEREKVLSFYTPEATGKSSSPTITVTEPHFRIHADSAVVIVRENIVIKVGEQSREMAMRATCTFRKEHGKWLIGSAQYTGIRK